MAAVFVNSPKFTEAVAFLNTLNTDKLQVVLERLVQNLHLKEESAFTPEEEVKLQKVFRTDKDGVDTIIDTCSYIFQQFAYNNVSSLEKATSSLAERGMDEPHRSIFVETWGQHGKTYLAHLRQHRLGGPTVLRDIDCQVRLRMTDSATAVQHDPSAILQLVLGCADTPEEREQLTMQMSFQETYDLFQKLDKLQGQVDRMLAQ